MKIYQSIIGFMAVGLLSGCVSNKPIQIANLPETNKFVVNKAVDKDYPVALGSNNIYSCRYGIFYKENKEFSPSKDVLFERLLYKYKKDLASHKVELEQFDVYFNKRKSLLPSVLGGMIGYIGFVDNADKYENKTLLVDVIPLSYPIKTDESAVGCDNYMEGGILCI